MCPNGSEGRGNDLSWIDMLVGLRDMKGLMTKVVVGWVFAGW
ncbi:MAG: hypothetical protein V7785_03245 [Bermanella sp.]